MNAIKLLEQQHRKVEKLFEKFEDAGDGSRAKKRELARQIMDALAAHATIEEKIFYPATKDARTEELLHEAVEEHLGAKRIIADLVEQDLDDEVFDAKVKVLQEQIEHHVEEEEKDLFPKARKLLNAEELDDLGDQMQTMYSELIGEEPRMQVPNETGEAPHL